MPRKRTNNSAAKNAVPVKKPKTAEKASPTPPTRICPKRGAPAADATPDKKPRLFSEEKIRVGRDYQSQIPAYIRVSERKPEEQCFERALLVWSPASGTISDQKCKYSLIQRKLPNYCNIMLTGNKCSKFPKSCDSHKHCSIQI